jgi:hypothetical protein
MKDPPFSMGIFIHYFDWATFSIAISTNYQRVNAMAIRIMRKDGGKHLPR